MTNLLDLFHQLDEMVETVDSEVLQRAEDFLIDAVPLKTFPQISETMGNGVMFKFDDMRIQNFLYICFDSTGDVVYWKRNATEPANSYTLNEVYSEILLELSNRSNNE